MPLSRMLFIGCGGSGLDTIRLVRRQLEQRLSLIGISSDQFPDAWQFVNIDVPSNNTATDQTLLDTRGITYVPLTAPQMTYRPPHGIETILAGNNDRDQNWDFVQWRPNPARAAFAITEGAGNVRAFGRAIGAYSLDQRARGQFIAAIERMNNTTDDAGLLPVEQKLGITPAANRDSRVVIVSSLGGGAGSGIFMDVADCLRVLRNEEWLGESMAFLYEPSVFETELRFLSNGISSNSLMALAELVAGQINPYQETPYLAAAVEGQMHHRGPRIQVLVSRQNMTHSAVSTDRSDAYKVTADLLTTLTISEDIAHRVYAQLSTNLDTYPNPSELMKSERPWGFFGMGCARIITGHEIFALYAAERMTHRAMDLASSLGRDNESVEKAIRQGKTTREAEIARIIEGTDSHGPLGVEFLRQCGLYEDGRANNHQVIDRLRGALQEATDGTKQRLKAVVQNQLDSTTKGGPLIWTQVWATLNNSRIVVLDDDWEAPELSTALQQVIDSWSAELQVNILDAVTDYVFEYGIHVTLAIIEMITEQLRNQIPGQIREEVRGLRESKENPLQKLFTLLNEKKHSKTTVDAVRKDIEIHLDAWVSDLEQREVSSTAATLLADLANNVFTPIKQALLLSKQEMERDVDQRIKELSDEEVAPHLTPTRAQILLTPVTDFPTHFNRLVTANGGDKPIRDAFQGRYDPGAAEDADSRLTDDDPQAAWRAQARWAPNVGANGAERLQISFDFTLDAVLHRCTEWLRSPASPTHDFVGENIRSYVLDEAGDGLAKAERTQRFANCLAEGIAIAPPKVNLDTQYLEAVLGVKNITNWDLISVPFSQGELGENASARIVDLLSRQGIQNPATCFAVPANIVQELPIFSSTKVFTPESVAPLAGHIALNYDTVSHVDFWLGRRARPLPQAISLPEATVLQITRGWITARLLDLVSIDTAERTCTLTDPADGAQYEMVTSVPGFDGPAEATIEAWEYLGGALEAAFLSHLYLRYGRNQGWDALRLLFRLGSSQGQEQSSNYDQLNPLLTGLGLPGLDKYFAPAADLAGALDMVIEEFSGDSVEIRPSRDWERVPLHHQISKIICDAATTIRHASEPGADNRPANGNPVHG